MTLLSPKHRLSPGFLTSLTPIEVSRISTALAGLQHNFVSLEQVGDRSVDIAEQCIAGEQLTSSDGPVQNKRRATPH